jgi:4-diphosphocytidyl-2-C-methyl-D-erythritol kinase
MILFPPAKVNLGLNVLSKRSDGFHEIETCMLEVPLCDVLEIKHSKAFVFKTTGLEINGNDEDNLCVRAFRLLEIEHNLTPVYIHLRKIIPMGAGLGGGSSDATYVLLGLNELFDLKLSDEQLEKYASQLGSDCPFFVQGKIQIAKGRGELLENFNLDLSGKFIKLVNPEIHIGTTEAYSNVRIGEGNSIEKCLKNSIHNWKGNLTSSFEEHAFEMHSELATIKESMYNEGAVYAAMSGSGSTMFGIYEERPELSGYALEWVIPFDKLKAPPVSN